MRLHLRAASACLVVFMCTGCSFGFGRPLTFGGETGISPSFFLYETPEQMGQVTWYQAGDPDTPRILYIHGTPGSATDYEAYLLDPLPGRESVAVDRVGFGRSNAGPDRHGAMVSFEQQAAALAPLLVERGGVGTLVVGHSLGGPIALRLAADYPDRIAGVVVLAGSVDPQLEDLKWFNYVLEFPFLGFFLGDPIQRSNAEVFAAQEQCELLAGVLDRVTCPVVVVHGRKDELVPFGNVAYLESHLPNAASRRVIPLDDADHFIPWTHESVVREAVWALSEQTQSAVGRDE